MRTPYNRAERRAIEKRWGPGAAAIFASIFRKTRHRIGAPRVAPWFHRCDTRLFPLVRCTRGMHHVIDHEFRLLGRTVHTVTA